HLLSFLSLLPRPPTSPLFPYTTLFRSNLDPQIERQVERVLILADKPVMRRPIPAAVVLDALPKACEADATLCERVRRFLANYMRSEEHTSELQSPYDLVCRLLLEKKNK